MKGLGRAVRNEAMDNWRRYMHTPDADEAWLHVHMGFYQCPECGGVAFKNSGIKKHHDWHRDEEERQAQERDELEARWKELYGLLAEMGVKLGMTVEETARVPAGCKDISIGTDPFVGEDAIWGGD